MVAELRVSFNNDPKSGAPYIIAYEQMKCRYIIKARQSCRSENFCWNKQLSDIYI